MVYSNQYRVECCRRHRDKTRRLKRMRITRLEIFCFAAMAVIVIAAVMHV